MFVVTSEKPACLTVTLYSPARRLVTEYEPLLVLVVVRAAFVAVLTTVTVAPDTHTNRFGQTSSESDIPNPKKPKLLKWPWAFGSQPACVLWQICDLVQ